VVWSEGVVLRTRLEDGRREVDAAGRWGRGPWGTGDTEGAVGSGVWPQPRGDALVLFPLRFWFCF